MVIPLDALSGSFEERFSLNTSYWTAVTSVACYYLRPPKARLLWRPKTLVFSLPAAPSPSGAAGATPTLVLQVSFLPRDCRCHSYSTLSKKTFFNGSSEWSKVPPGTFCYLNQAKESPDYTQLWRTIKGSSAQRSAETFKGSRWNLLEMVLGGTLSEEP